MPTIIALDISFSMTCAVSELDEITHHKLAIQGIKDLLNYLSIESKLEFVSLLTFSSSCEVVVDYTRDYDSIRQALKKIEHRDTVNYETLFETATNSLVSNWGTQSLCQILVFTDCGLGLGPHSIRNMVNNASSQTTQTTTSVTYPFMKYLQDQSCRLHFIGIGSSKDWVFTYNFQVLQEFLTVNQINGHCYKIKPSDNLESKFEISKSNMTEVVNRVCEENYKPFEGELICGNYFRLRCPITLWPNPIPYKCPTKQTTMNISSKIQLCGIINVSDIGSPVAISRHLIFPKIQEENEDGKNAPSDFEILEKEIRMLYSKGDGNTSEDEESKHLQPDAHKENLVVLLHGALKVDNKAALVFLNANWYGFLYPYSDNKKKSNLMLAILQPGNKIIPWLGDIRHFGTAEDISPGEALPTFPVKSEKRSYSQNIVVWIKACALTSDIQKVLRHAKKLPEKTPHFYKELNRIRRAALAIGFIELLDTLANILDKEISNLPQTSNSDFAVQLKHAAEQLRKNRDFKSSLTALPTKYNQGQ